MPKIINYVFHRKNEVGTLPWKKKIRKNKEKKGTKRVDVFGTVQKNIREFVNVLFFLLRKNSE